jgi:hypothetical protein
MPLAGFEPTIPVFKRAKTFHALDRAATVTGDVILMYCRFYKKWVRNRIKWLAQISNNFRPRPTPSCTEIETIIFEVKYTGGQTDLPVLFGFFKEKKSCCIAKYSIVEPAEDFSRMVPHVAYPLFLRSRTQPTFFHSD